MPIYEYQGQQYDIATEDRAVAKAKILKHLGTPEKAPAPKPTQAASDDYDFGSPMGTGAEEIMAQANAPRKTYTGSVFDTQPFNPPFDLAEADRMSRRAYAEKGPTPQGRVQEMRATPKDQIERSALKAAGDTTIGILQGMVAIPKGIVDNIPFDNPLSQFFKDAYEAGERSKSGYLRSKSIERSALLDNVRKNQGELAAARASFNSMFSPTGADIIAQGAGSIVPTMGLSVLNLGAKSMTAMNVLANAGDAAQQTAAKLADLSPEQWSNSAAYQALREKGLDHRDAVRMLAPLYALPAQVVGGITGKISGSTGLEKALVKGGERTARARAGRAGAELLGEELESLAPQFTGNVTQRLLDDKASLIEGLGQTAVETLFGTLPGAGLAAVVSKGRAKQAAPAPTTQAVEPAKEAVELPKARIEPSLGEAALAPEPTTARVEPELSKAALAPEPATVRAAPEFSEAALPPEPTTARVEPTLAPEEQAAAPAEAAPVTETVAPTEQVKAIAERLQKRGIPRKTALAMAEREVEANELTKAERGGVEDVTSPVPAPSGESVSVAGQPSPKRPAGGVAGVEPSGVVPAGQDVARATVGETTQPTPLEQTPVTPSEAPAPVGETAAQAAPTETPETPTTEIKGAELGTETPEAQQATQEGQAAPAAAGVTPAKRGRPPVQQTNLVVENPAGGFDHVANGDVVATYTNKKQATAAVNLAKAQTKGDPALIAKNQAKLEAAMTSPGRGRPANATVETETGTKKLDKDTKEELDALESALNTYNSPAEKDSVLNAAMYINDAANDPTVPEAVRERAKQMLADDVDPKDIPKKLRSIEGRAGKGDKGFNKLTNAAQAATYVAKTGTPFQKFVAERIRNYVVGVKFVVLEKGDKIPAEMRNARGLFVYDPAAKEQTVYVRGTSFGDGQGVNNVTVLHELLHAATARRITIGIAGGTKSPQLTKFIDEMQVLADKVQAVYEMGVDRGTLSQEMQDLVEGTLQVNMRTGEANFEIFSSPYEFLAYGMSSDQFQNFLMGIEGTRKSETGFSKFVSNIRNLFGIKQGDATAFSDLVDITDSILNAGGTSPTVESRQVFQQKAPLTEEQKAQREKEKAVTRALKAVDRSIEAEKISEETTVLQRLRSLDVTPVLKEAAKGMKYAQKQAIAKALSTPLVAEIGGVNVEELKNTNRLLEEMEATKMEMLRAGAKTVEDVKRLVPTQESRDKINYAGALFTASRIDPRVDTSVPRLNKIYNDLTDNEKKALDEIVGYYDDIADNFDFILGENVKALRPGEATKLTAALREVLGKDNRIPFYNPLARDQNGEFFLRVGTTEFHIRKTLAERDRLAEAIAEERNTTVQQLIEDREIEVGDDIEVLRKKVLDSSDALRRLFIMIDDADFTAEEHGASLQKAKDGMKDSMFQLWLHMQPESSSRKQFIHRNKYPPAGFRTDIIQNLAESVLKFSNNMARLEYAPKLRRSISQAHASIAQRSEYTPYVAEMALRVDDTLAPEKQSTAMGLARFGNSFTFGYYMSESTALLQLLSVYQVGTAQLVKKFPVAAVAKEAAKMGQIWNTVGVKDENGNWAMPTIEQALNLKSRPTDSAKVRLEKEQDRAFIDAMHERNVSEATGARDLQGYKDLPTEKYGSKYEQAKRIGRFAVGGLIHATERLSREVMFMSSAHLIRNKAVEEFRKTAEYKNAPDKIAAERAFGEANLGTWADEAKVYTDAALFNYSKSAKPRYMRGATGTLALQFFTYQLNVGSFIARNFIGMIKPLPGETRTECFRAFNTLMATTFSLGGTSALFGGPIVLGLISVLMKLFKKEDEPDELKDIDLYERFKIFLHEQLGDVTVGGKSLAKIVDQGPINAFTGLDVSSRTSVSNILTPPEIRAARTPREGVLNYAQLYGGPNLQAVLSLADGVDLLIKGEHYRGFEKLMPWAVVRNKMTAVRQYTEGEKGLKLGDDVIEAELFYTGELVGQAVGLRPVLLSDVAAANRKAHEVVTKVANKRAAILDRLDRADRKGDDKAYLAALEEQQKFNAKVSLEFPRLQISEEDRFNFIQGRNEARRTSFGGFQYTPQNEVIAEQITARSREALVKREKEVADRKKNPQ